MNCTMSLQNTNLGSLNVTGGAQTSHMGFVGYANSSSIINISRLTISLHVQSGQGTAGLIGELYLNTSLIIQNSLLSGLVNGLDFANYYQVASLVGEVDVNVSLSIQNVTN